MPYPDEEHRGDFEMRGIGLPQLWDYLVGPEAGSPTRHIPTSQTVPFTKAYASGAKTLKMSKLKVNVSETFYM